MRLTPHLQLMSRLRIIGALPPLCLYALMACTGAYLYFCNDCNKFLGLSKGFVYQVNKYNMKITVIW